jgi:hypothetical protein
MANPDVELATKSNDHGFEDPNSSYPSSVNWFKPVYGDETEELDLGGSKPGFPLDVPNSGNSVYPNYHKIKTSTGHVISLDDTEDNKRILIRHAEGAGIELKPDGSVCILAKKNIVTVANGDQTVIIEGEGKLSFGKLKIETNDLDIDVKGTYTLNAQKKIENITEDVILNYGNTTQTINGTYLETRTGASTEQKLGGVTEYIKGNHKIYTQGNLEFSNTGDLIITSDDITLAGDNINIAGSDVSVFGSSGMIGGDNVEFKGKTATLTTIHGDLNGTALKANATSSQNYAQSATSGTAYSFTNTAATRISLTPEDINALLENSEKGIRKVSVDPGDFTKNLINKEEETGGVSKAELTTEKYRSKFRDQSNLANSVLMGNAILSDKISSGAGTPIPPAIGRSKPGTATPKFGQTPIGNLTIAKQSNLFEPKELSDVILPAPQFNPNFKETIDENTLLAPGVRISDFLGGNDPITLDHIRDDETALQQLARNLYIHAEILSSFRDVSLKLFYQHRLVVSEGVYKAGPNETVTPGSSNDLSRTGRLIWYRLVNKDGQFANEKLFDLADWWKDTLSYDNLILDWDTYSPETEAGEVVISGQLGLEIPNMSETFEAQYKKNVKTTFNNSTFKNNEIVEVLSEPMDTINDPVPEQAPEPEGLIRGFTKEQTQNYLFKLGERESSNDYKSINRLGFAGKYQFGVLALFDRGYITRAGVDAYLSGTSHNYVMRTAGNQYWTGKGGINNVNDFVSNPGIQEKIIIEHTNSNLATLRSSRLGGSVIYSDDTVSVVAGLLFGAHLLGAGDARKWKLKEFENMARQVDANGVGFEKYYRIGSIAVNDQSVYKYV